MIKIKEKVRYSRIVFFFCKKINIKNLLLPYVYFKNLFDSELHNKKNLF